MNESGQAEGAEAASDNANGNSARVRRLQGQIGVPKKSTALKAGWRRWARAEAVGELSGDSRSTCWNAPGWRARPTTRWRIRKAAPGPSCGTPPGDIHARSRCGLPNRDVPAPRAPPSSLTRPCSSDWRDGLRCGAFDRTDYHGWRQARWSADAQVSIGRDFAADGRGRDGADVTEFKCSFGKAYLNAGLRLGSGEIAARSRYRVAEHGAHGTRCSVCSSCWCPPARIGDGVRHGLATPERQVRGRLRGAGFDAEHVAQGNCLSNACTEGCSDTTGLDLPGPRPGRLLSPGADLEAYIVHWKQCWAERLKPSPGGVPESVLDGGIAASFN